MTDVTTTVRAPQAPTPHPMLDALRPLCGTWRLEGRDLDGGAPFAHRLRRYLMPGGFYLVEHVDDPEREATGIQYVGFDPVAEHLRGMYFSADGPGPYGSFALEYVWEVDDRDVTIWCGDVGSPARYTGRFDAAQAVLTGRWTWPGGGYDVVETRTG